MRVEIVASETVEGGRGIFESSAVTAAVHTMDVRVISESIKEFCQEFMQGLSEIEHVASKYSLERIELAIDLTVKGEIRLIASASAETKGSVKLIFSASQQSTV